MNFFALLFLYFLFGGAFLYLLMCVDANQPGFLGKVNRLIFTKCPKLLKLFQFYFYN